MGEPTDSLYWIPTASESIIDVDILATPEHFAADFGGERQLINKVTALSQDLTERIRSYGIRGSGDKQLKDAIAEVLVVPRDMININSNVPLSNVTFSPATASSGTDPF